MSETRKKITDSDVVDVTPQSTDLLPIGRPGDTRALRIPASSFATAAQGALAAAAMPAASLAAPGGAALVGTAASETLAERLVDVTARRGGKLSALTQYAAQKVLRMYVGGTSIENSTTSWVRLFCGALFQQFGDSKNFTQHLGVLGGTYEVAASGWKKQPFGGIGFVRIRGETTSSTLALLGYAKRAIIRYSKETNGSTFDVYVDGVLHGTIDCNGAQSYNNEYVIVFSTLTPSAHSVELHAPGANYAYVEAIDWCVDDVGLHMFDATKGGSSLRDMVTLYPAAGAQVSGIAIGANVAIDAYFAKTSADYLPDIAIVAWVVNDAGLTGLYATVYEPALQRIVEKTKEVGTHLILVVEMGGSHAMPAAAGHTQFNQIRALMRSFEGEPHVTVIDWHAQSYPPADDALVGEWQDWADKYYGATITNLATAAFTGDFVHPGVNGHAIAAEMAQQAAGVPSQGLAGMGESGLRLAAWSEAAPAIGLPLLSMHDPLVVPGTTREAASQEDVLRSYTCVGYSIAGATQPLGNGGARIPLWTSPEELDWAYNINAAIQSSGAGPDKYGKYTTGSNWFGYVDAPTYLKTNGYSTLSIVVAPNSSGNLRMRASNNVTVDTQYVRGVSLGALDLMTWSNPTDKPMVFHWTIKRGGRIAVTVNGPVYAFHCTATDFPCIPGRDIVVNREVAGPLPIVGDLLSEKAMLGQVFHEVINAITVEKQVIEKRVLRIPALTYAPLYRILNRTVTNILRTMTLAGTVTLDVYDEAFGGTPQKSAGSGGIISVFIAQHTLTADEVYTLSGKLKGQAALAIYLYNGGLNTYLHLNTTTGVWTQGTISSNVTTFNVQDSEQFCVTFALPSAAQMTAVGATAWAINLRMWGGTIANWRSNIFTLAAGNGAAV